jgi:hypothetical protein
MQNQEQNPPRTLRETFREEVKNLPRWNITEPSDEEFEEFKKRFMHSKQKDADLRKLTKYIGQLQSTIDELNHIVSSLFEQKVAEMNATQYKDFMMGLMALKKKAAEEGMAESKYKKLRRQVDEMQAALIKHNIKWNVKLD